MEVDKKIVAAEKPKNKLTAEQIQLLDEKIPEYRQIPDVRQAADAMLSLEKVARNAEDVTATSRVATTIVEMCWERKDLPALNEYLVVLSKRRGQLKTAVQHIVQKAMSFLGSIPDEKAKVTLIETLRSITEGKIYVELERARLTQMLAGIREAAGGDGIATASKLLQEIQVETFGSMDKMEKTAFLLEQVRLCLDTNDFIRALIISNKVNRSILMEPAMMELKLKFYDLMVRYYSNSRNYLEIARCYNHIFDTKSVLEDPSKWQKALRLVVAFVVLAPFSQEQDDLTQRVSQEKKLKEITDFNGLLKLFTTNELMRWPALEGLYKDSLSPLLLFSGEMAEKTWSDLKDRVIEHNVRVIAKFYTRITMKRLSELLDLSESEAETYVSRLVVSKDITARIDRPAGCVTLGTRSGPAQTIDRWADDVSSLVLLVEDATHLIRSEYASFSHQESK
eukprot:TRINITY_DN22714_c0_g1_i1.p1 TRINITY_DN22714_c0_g1~~TRINITY_DN22714_c0_g1_i1.p1  ORF type:complete len:452 (+),score=103.07 TRINITY_DN22714_c0_g1_i1:6-1361(+)